MKILHILRSEPDEMTQIFIRELSRDVVSSKIPLYQGEVGYDELVKEIFDSDRVISWW